MTLTIISVVVMVFLLAMNWLAWHQNNRDSDG